MSGRCRVFVGAPHVAARRCAAPVSVTPRHVGRGLAPAVGGIGGGAPYTEIGRRVGLEKFRQRAAYFLRAEKVGKDALRGTGPMSCAPPLRCGGSL